MVIESMAQQSKGVPLQPKDAVKIILVSKGRGESSGGGSQEDLGILLRIL
jgi:hypothetical protein